MRYFIKDILTKRDAKCLCNLNVDKYDFSNSIMKKITKKIKNVIGDISLSKPSYYNIDSSQNGHNWHKDTGTHGHMLWCNYGVSILLKKSEGGLFKYKNPYKTYNQEEHYLNAIIHSSDEWHMVEPSKKGRTVLLMFL